MAIRVTFDTTLNPPKFVIYDQGEYDNPNSVMGLFEITGPDGSVIYENNNPAAPDIIYAESFVFSTVSIPLDINGKPLKGNYTFTYTAFEIESITPIPVVVKTVNLSYCDPKPELEITVDCLCGKITSKDITDYNGAEVVRTHTLTPPAGLNFEPIVSASAEITANPLYTKTWTSTLSSTFEISVGEYDTVLLKLATTASKEVTCAYSVNEIICCIAALNRRYEQTRHTNKVLAEKYFQELTRVTQLKNLIEAHIRLGEYDPADILIKELKSIINCEKDCGCGDNSQPVLVDCGCTESSSGPIRCQKGDKGDSGEAGVGIAGGNGEPGVDGTYEGQIYVDLSQDPSVTYVWTGTEWEVTSSTIILTPGSIGPQGPQGPQGLSFLQGSGVPSSSLGISGDTYLNIANGDIYKKFGSSWAVTGNISNMSITASSLSDLTAFRATSTVDQNVLFKSTTGSDSVFLAAMGVRFHNDSPPENYDNGDNWTGNIYSIPETGQYRFTLQNFIAYKEYDPSELADVVSINTNSPVVALVRVSSGTLTLAAVWSLAATDFSILPDSGSISLVAITPNVTAIFSAGDYAFLLPMVDVSPAPELTFTLDSGAVLTGKKIS
jgi:hypothetical protein